MMIILQHIQNGLTLAANSFLLLWHHKKLLIYLLVPVLLNLSFGIYSAYDFVYALIARGAPSDFFLVIKAMSKAIVADLGIACLSVHTYTLLEHQTSSIRATLHTVAYRAPIIMTWSFITGTIIYISLIGLHMMQIFCENAGFVMHIKSLDMMLNPAIVLQMLLGIIWIVVVFFMIQILAIEEFSIVESFQTSWALSRALILEIIGGEFWIGLIWFLSILPFMIIFEKPMAYHLFTNKPILDQWSWTTTCALIIAGWVCASAQAVFRTKLYHRYYTEPLQQEIDVMFYPRF